MNFDENVSKIKTILSKNLDSIINAIAEIEKKYDLGPQKAKMLWHEIRNLLLDTDLYPYIGNIIVEYDNRSKNYTVYYIKPGILREKRYEILRINVHEIKSYC